MQIKLLGQSKPDWFGYRLAVTLGWGVALSGYGQSSSYQTDTAYVNSLLKKGEAVETRQPQVALNFYRQAHQKAGQIRFTQGYFESLRVLTYQLNNTGRYQEAKKLALDGLKLALQDTSKRNRGICYFALANTALYDGHPAEAIPHYQRAAAYMRQLGKLKNVAVINQNLGIIYERQ
ncbi:MAG: tetratricopeptide repeat protein [Bacteroidetes bacterium]|nr:tetratricopeptide repeat protein [Fibrella sp.]